MRSLVLLLCQRWQRIYRHMAESNFRARKADNREVAVLQNVSGIDYSHLLSFFHKRVMRKAAQYETDLRIFASQAQAELVHLEF